MVLPPPVPIALLANAFVPTPYSISELINPVANASAAASSSSIPSRFACLYTSPELITIPPPKCPIILAILGEFATPKSLAALNDTAPTPLAIAPPSPQNCTRLAKPLPIPLASASPLANMLSVLAAADFCNLLNSCPNL